MINFDSKKIIYFVFFCSLIIGLSYNEYNLQVIRKKNPNNLSYNCQSTFNDETVFSVDDEFYLTPPENFLAGKGWRRDPPLGNGTYFRRVPGYSLVYLFFRLFFDVPLALKLLKFFQLLLFGLSVIYVQKIISLLKLGSLLAACIALLYGVTPFFSSYSYFTSTESITPVLCVFYLYFLVKGYSENDPKKRNSAYLLAGFFLGISILTRPTMALLGLPIPFCIFLNSQKGQGSSYLKNCLAISVFPFLLLGSWTIRNFIVTKEIVVLEKAVHAESLDREKPEYVGILNFIKCWGGKATADFNDYYIPFQTSVLIDGDSSNVYIEKVLNAWPEAIINEYGRERLFTLLKKHQNSLFKQKPYYDKQIAMPSSYFEEELEVGAEYDDLVKEYKQKHFMNYWIVTPLQNIRSITFHSNTSHLLIFQKEVLGKPLYIYKLFLFLFHVILYLCILFNLFFIKDLVLKSIFALTPLISIFFFCFIFRGLEQRYMLPVLPIMVIGLAFPFHYLRSKKRPS